MDWMTYEQVARRDPLLLISKAESVALESLVQDEIYQLVGS